MRPYFEQRSTAVKTGDVLEIQQVKFKVIATRPAEGGPGETGETHVLLKKGTSSAALNTGFLGMKSFRHARHLEGGGVGKETEFACQGVALKESFNPPARAKPAAKSGAAKAAAKFAAAKAAARSDDDNSQCQLM